MAIIKNYTDISQSKKLTEFLSIESADMVYIWHATRYDKDMPPMVLGDVPINKIYADTLPCWSLSALISIIPQEIFNGEYIINITEGRDNRWVLTYDEYEDRTNSYYGLSSGADNLVDACVTMIEKLKELNLL